jgi:hypothetical protein
MNTDKREIQALSYRCSGGPIPQKPGSKFIGG